MGDDVEVGHLLGILGEELEEASILNAVVVIVAGVHVETRLGHGPGADVEHVRQAFADGGVERLVHVGDALPGGEVGGPQAAHGHAGGDGGGSMFTFGLDENQWPTGDVEVALRSRLGPEFTHLCGGRDRIGAGGIRGLSLTGDGCRAAVHGVAGTGVSEGSLTLGHEASLSPTGFDVAAADQCCGRLSL